MSQLQINSALPFHVGVEAWVIPGAFAATVLECLFPRGLTDHGTPQDGGVSLRTSSTVFNRMMPYWSENDRRRHAPADATQRLYHLSAPLRLSRNGRTSLSPDGSEEPLTRDVQEVARLLGSMEMIGLLMLYNTYMYFFSLFLISTQH